MQAALKFKKECFFYHVIQKNQLRFLIMYRSVKVLNTLSHSRILIRIVIFYLFDCPTAKFGPLSGEH